MTISKEGLLAKCERIYREFTIRSGETIRIQTLTELEKAEIELLMLNNKGSVDVRKLPESKLRTMCACMVDGEGKRLFSDDEWRSLQPLNSSVVAEIYSECLEHIGFEDAEVEELVGKSD
jgi:hypothetical protein